MLTTPIKFRVKRDVEVERYRRVIDLILDRMTIEAIRQLINEIEAEIAKTIH